MNYFFTLIVGIGLMACLYMSFPSPYSVDEMRGTVQFPNNIQMPALIVKRHDNQQFVLQENEYNKQLIDTFGNRGCHIYIDGDKVKLRCNDLVGDFLVLNTRENTYGEGGLQF